MAAGAVKLLLFADHCWGECSDFVMSFYQLLIHLFVCFKQSFPYSQFLFVVTFTTFLVNCVEYDILFANRAVNHTGPGHSPLDRNKVTLPDAILPSQQCTQRYAILYAAH